MPSRPHVKRQHLRQRSQQSNVAILIRAVEVKLVSMDRALKKMFHFGREAYCAAFELAECSPSLHPLGHPRVRHAIEGQVRLDVQ